MSPGLRRESRDRALLLIDSKPDTIAFLACRQAQSFFGSHLRPEAGSCNGTEP